MRVQIADAGKVLINDDTYSDRVYLGEGAAPWQEIDAPDDLESGLYTLIDGKFELTGEVIE